MKPLNEKKDRVQNEGLDKVWGRHRAGAAISMGVGKTLVGLRYIERYLREVNFNARFLVAVPGNAILKSWKDDAKDFELEHCLERITFTTYLSLTKQDISLYHVLILDEMHSLKDSHRPWLQSFRGMILGLTGTKPRSEKSEKGKLINEFAPIVYEYLVEEAVTEGLLNDYRIFLHHVELSQEKDLRITTKDGTRSWVTSEYANHRYYCDRIHENANDQMATIMRVKAMMDYPSKLVYADKLLKSDLAKERTLVFCNTTEQADRLCINTYHSKNPESDWNLQAFADGAYNHMGCVQQLSVGTNTRGVYNSLILHSYSNEHKTAQRLGRCLRLDPDETAYVHILVYKDSIDEHWCRAALKDFDPTKIFVVNP